MNFLIHLIYTLIFSELLNLNFYNFILALIFGLLIDLDHIFLYIPTLIKTKKIIPIGVYLKTFIQEPVFYPIVICISLILKTLTPLIFFTLHLILDYIFSSKNRPFFPFSKLEINGPFNLKTKFYWIFTLFSIILFCIYFLINDNYNYLIELIKQSKL
jgi:hypothetical protein